jgi:hypothetical protein
LSCRSKERAHEAPSPPPSAPPIVEAAKEKEKEKENEKEEKAPSKPFLEMYVAGWSLRDRPAFSFEGVTDVILFSVLPKPDGSLDATTNGLTDERIAAMAKEARAQKARVLVAIGGEKTAARFAAKGIAVTLATFVKAHDLDGVVLDVEPLAEIPHESLAALAHDVKEAIAPRIVTVVVAPDPAEIARLGALVGDVDRVTIMSYLGEPAPAREDALVDALVAVGFDRSRVGLGIGPKTLIEARKNRLSRVREGRAGGVALWGIMDAGGLRP